MGDGRAAERGAEGARPEAPLRARKTADREHAEKLKALGNVAKRFGAFRPAHEVLFNVRSVPTIFPWVNVVSQVGGWPTARFTLLHGPSGDGKTEFGLGLGMSFLKGAHFFAHIDAEQTTPFSWSRQLMGPLADSPGYVALRPETYEQTRNEVRRFCDVIAEARVKGDVDKDTTGIILLDSIRKLVPKNIWDELTNEAAGKAARGAGGKAKVRGIDGMGGRAAQIKAALNAAWLDELIQLLAKTDVAMACIARETIDDDGDEKIGGGRALVYDSSLRVRVERHSFFTDGGEGKDAVLYGEKRAIVVHKTKLAGREERWPVAYYHSTNGNLEGVPAGFDRPRDVLSLALDVGAAELSGSWVKFAGENIGQGQNKAVQRLHADPGLLARLEAAALEREPPVEVLPAESA